jgi:uncharacterized protein with von Willebrand factor type A (vWA) domain
MFLSFLYELRRRKVPVGTHEAVALARALGKGLHDSSLDGFYHVARALLVHSESHLDAFDQAFLAHFKGVQDAGVQLTSDLLDWLRDAVARRPELSDEERALLDALDLDELEALFRQRLREQKERHDGGSRWIGTGGSSPFGHSGVARPGIRMGGPGGNRSALRVAGERRYQGYRSDVALDVRQLQVALRKLRAFAREGTAEELDLEETIAETARNAGELEVVTRPPRRPNTRVVLLMDVGGSMDPYVHLMSRLFTAASKATHFKDLRTYYFHNCVYGRVYRSARFTDAVPVTDLLGELGPHYKLIVVGDALMGPYELFERGGGLGWNDPDGLEGVEWLRRLAAHFERHVWLNPEAQPGWYHPTIRAIGGIFPMFPLTLEGLGEAVAHLVRGRRRAA